MAAPKKEITIVKAIVDYLNHLPQCWAEKTHGDIYGNQRLDITGCLAGTRLELEVKREGLQPTLRQAETMRRWARAGALAACVHSVEEAEAVIRHGSPQEAPDGGS